MLKYFELHSKEIYQRLMLIKKGWGSKKLEKIINQQYQQMPKISIDYALIEKIAQKIVVIPAAIGWSDVGSWSSLYDILKNKLGENIAVGCEHLHLDSKEILIHGNKKLIATIGVENMVIIDSGDVILICHKERTQDIKKLVDHLQSEKRKEYL
jgi:mannose-1-phosphate guanylyltransferase